ncbi:MAG TPA: UDP-N-acetylmuramate dehydrogenase [Candidatus Saccharimonadales bacterium]|nr:UDP-N-acetylmuramate dehydrogenase [Candidatus Saccharimonadales bacterium]
MQVQSNVSLKNYVTMRLGGTAHALTTVKSKQELLEALAWAQDRSLPHIVLGGGSNVIFKDGFHGLVIINRLPGFKVIKQHKGKTHIQIGAGENWDNVVKKTVDLQLHGIEFLSAIPGTAGATPVQNVGAYGAQISDVFVELEAYDLTTKTFVTLTKDDCQFSYRSSIFKSIQNRRYIITSITLELTAQNPTPPFYASLQRYLDDHAITEFTPLTIRQAVVAIRAVRLPDPSRVANTGSFFKNPIVHADKAAELLAAHPDMPHWPMPDGRVKLAAGWLIDEAGLKGYASHGMKTYEQHALVLINEHAASYQDLATFQQEITDTVQRLFGVELQQEPELM